MQRRPPHAEHGGLWEFPGGKREPGESEVTALVRELGEELRILVDPFDFTRVAAASLPGEPHVIALYSLRGWQGVPRADADAQVAWFAPQRIVELAMPPLDYPLARALMDALGIAN
jgi:8-oxo-dGTP diphosphatase